MPRPVETGALEVRREGHQEALQYLVLPVFPSLPPVPTSRAEALAPMTPRMTSAEEAVATEAAPRATLLRDKTRPAAQAEPQELVHRNPPLLAISILHSPEVQVAAAGEQILTRQTESPDRVGAEAEEQFILSRLARSRSGQRARGWERSPQTVEPEASVTKHIFPLGTVVGAEAVGAVGPSGYRLRKLSRTARIRGLLISARETEAPTMETETVPPQGSEGMAP